jgi:hypothetical protein
MEDIIGCPAQRERTVNLLTLSRITDQISLLVCFSIHYLPLTLPWAIRFIFVTTPLNIPYTSL